MEEEILKEIKVIKNLLIIKLKREGVSTDDIGQALGVTGQAIRASFPTRTKKKR